MTLPLRLALAERRRRKAFAAILLVFALCVANSPASADDPDPFTATVAVDATADTAAKARDAARSDGQRRALAAIAEHLAGSPAAAAKLTKLDDKAVTDLVASFEVANERMSGVRYIADYTFHFRPAELKRLLGNAGITVADQGQAGKSAVILPLYKAGGAVDLWEDPNPWREAWNQRAPATGGVHLVVPLGDAADVAAIDAERAQAGDAAALARVARRNGGDEVLVALATMRGPTDAAAGVDVTVRRYRAGQLADTHEDSLVANPGESAGDLLRRTVVAIGADIAGGWKKEGGPRYDQSGSLTVILPIVGLDDWVRARDQIAALTTIRKVALVTLSRQEATIEIGYVGTIDQLKTALAGINFGLAQSDARWRLGRAGAGRPQ